jgi:hypothetical protein
MLMKTTTKLDEHAAAIRSLGKQTVASIIEIGKHLIAAKKIAGHGGWTPWLESEFGWSADTAQRFMRVADDKNRTVRSLDLPVKSMYLLTAPKTPQAARDAVIEKTKTTKLKHKDVAKIVKDAKPTKPLKVPVKPKAKSAKIIKLPPVSLNQQVNQCTRELGGFLDDWIASTEKFWMENHTDLNEEGQSALIHFTILSADRLTRLAQALDSNTQTAGASING